MDLFDKTDSVDPAKSPLAARMRPERLDDIVGQDHILGKGKLLRRAVEADRLGSIILYGPPGCGKTSLAQVIARTTKRRFDETSGVTANTETLRAAIETARYRKASDKVETILFVDEIHRFNKAQQDVLLPHVENGTVTLVGATTHNPQFFINGPLNSRSQLFELAPLSEEAVLTLLRRALTDQRGLAATGASADDDALRHLASACEGDARRALNALEIAVLTTEPAAAGHVNVTRPIAEDSIQKRVVLYDRDEDQHHDTISAFIKSVRGSDPHAALYWLAKMLHAGEDPRFIARRLVILASEDIGNADPRGLTIATATMQSVEFIGMPEARITLAQATTYLATAPKSNAAYLGIEKALGDVKNGRSLPVPEHLKNIRISAKAVASPHDADRDKTYVYPHDHNGHFAPQAYMPASAVYYEPTDLGYEDTIKKRMAHWNNLRAAAANGTGK
ncbi:MAG: replication-associated recombination protein A [bacterium]